MSATDTKTRPHTKYNLMVLELLKVLYELVRAGFYLASELGLLRESLLRLLDGRGDTIEEGGGALERDEAGVPMRYKVKHQVASDRTRACDTLVIMECKLWCCKFFELVCTIRLDIRLSQLLERYRVEWASNMWGQAEGDARDRAISGHAVALLGSFSKSFGRGKTYKAKPLLTVPEKAETSTAPFPQEARENSISFVGQIIGGVELGGSQQQEPFSLTESTPQPSVKQRSTDTREEMGVNTRRAPSRHRAKSSGALKTVFAGLEHGLEHLTGHFGHELDKERKEAFASLLDVLRLDQDPLTGEAMDLVAVLLDLTFYEHKEVSRRLQMPLYACPVPRSPPEPSNSRT